MKQLLAALTRDTAAFQSTGKAGRGFLAQLVAALRRDTPAFTGRRARRDEETTDAQP